MTVGRACRTSLRTLPLSAFAFVCVSACESPPASGSAVDLRGVVSAASSEAEEAGHPQRLSGITEVRILVGADSNGH